MRPPELLPQILGPSVHSFLFPDLTQLMVHKELGPPDQLETIKDNPSPRPISNTWCLLPSFLGAGAESICPLLQQPYRTGGTEKKVFVQGHTAQG